MLKSGSHEGRNGRNNDHDFVGRASRPERHPDGKTDEHVAKYGQEEELDSWQVRFGRSDRKRCFADSAAVKSMLPSEEHQCGSAHRARYVADIDQ